jgi:hypothetical protein
VESKFIIFITSLSSFALIVLIAIGFFVVAVCSARKKKTTPPTTGEFTSAVGSIQDGVCLIFFSFYFTLPYLTRLLYLIRVLRNKKILCIFFLLLYGMEFLIL